MSLSDGSPSRRDHQSKAGVRTPIDPQNRIQILDRELRVKAQTGNPAFLDKVCDAIRLEARLTRTEAPQQQQIETRISLEDLIAGSRADEGKMPSDETARHRPRSADAMNGHTRGNGKG